MGKNVTAIGVKITLATMIASFSSDLVAQYGTYNRHLFFYKFRFLEEMIIRELIASQQTEMLFNTKEAFICIGAISICKKMNAKVCQCGDILSNALRSRNYRAWDLSRRSKIGFIILDMLLVPKRKSDGK